MKLALLSVITCSFLLMTACVTIQVPTTETYYETEYRTEYKTETYTETQNVVISSKQDKKYLQPIVKWNDRLSFTGPAGQYSTYYYGYSPADSDFSPYGHSSVQVKVNISGWALQQGDTITVYDMTSAGQIPTPPTAINYFESSYNYAMWFDTVLIPKLNSARIIGKLDAGAVGPDYLTFDAKGMTDFAILVNSYNFYTISSVELTWSDDVTEQRTVTKQRQVPTQVPVQVARQRTVIETEQVPFWEAIWGK